MVELFTSTGEGFTFDSMIARFSFASTGKCNSMIELFTSKGEGFDSTIAHFSFSSAGKCKSMGELFTSTGTSTGKGFDSTIKFTWCLDTQQRGSVFKILHTRQYEIMLEFPRKNSRDPSLNCRSLSV